MNTEENSQHTAASHHSSSSHEITNVSNQVANNSSLTQNPQLISPESVDDGTQSVLQNFSKATHPYQRLNDGSQNNVSNNIVSATSNSNLAMVNGNMATKATDILKPRVAAGYKANVRHTGC